MSKFIGALKGIAEQYNGKKGVQKRHVTRYTLYVDFRLMNLMEVMVTQLGFKNVDAFIQFIVARYAKELVEKGSLNLHGTAAEDLLHSDFYGEYVVQEEVLQEEKNKLLVFPQGTGSGK